MSNRYGYSDKIAHELWKKSLVIDLRRVSNAADWDDLSPYASEEVMEKVDQVIDAIYAAGLAIVNADDRMRAEIERLREIISRMKAKEAELENELVRVCTEIEAGRDPYPEEDGR
jgi:Tfp pilus assembly PilM family ATPase